MLLLLIEFKMIINNIGQHFFTSISFCNKSSLDIRVQETFPSVRCGHGAGSKGPYIHSTSCNRLRFKKINYKTWNFTSFLLSFLSFSPDSVSSHFSINFHNFSWNIIIMIKEMVGLELDPTLRIVDFQRRVNKF